MILCNMEERKQNIPEEHELVRQSDIGEWHCFIDDDDTIPTDNTNTKEDKTFFKIFTFVVLLLVCIAVIACIFLSKSYN